VASWEPDVQVTLPHAGHVVVEIEIPPPVGVVEVHLLAAHEVYGLVAEELCPDVEHALTTHCQLRCVDDATSQPGNSSIR